MSIEYANYRVKINGTKVPDSMIAKGSYSFSRAKRVAGSVTDANGIEHEYYYDSDKVTIQFNIRQRNLQEHFSVREIFRLGGNVTVEYWDDVEVAYRRGKFKMDTPTTKHLNVSNGDIQYDVSTIKLEEM